MQNWQYDEFKQTGIDFLDDYEVQEYDEKYKGIRDYDSEVKFIAESLELNKNSNLLEIGTGTGEHAVRLSRLCKKLTACDVSDKMLSYATSKARKQNINNIEFVKSGFLNLTESDFDAALSQLALHHLPDFWKSAALQKVFSSLKPGGKFFLLDSILSLEIKNHAATINRIIESAVQTAGERIAGEIVINIRDEYPTYDWIIEGFLERTGFDILNKIKYTPLLSVYICCKR